MISEISMASVEIEIVAQNPFSRKDRLACPRESEGDRIYQAKVYPPPDPTEHPASKVSTPARSAGNRQRPLVVKKP